MESIITNIIMASDLLLFFLAIILLNQWCIPQVTIQATHHSCFPIMCDVPS